MPIAVECTCGKRFNVKDEWAGQTVQCQVCESSVIVPYPENESASQPVAETEQFYESSPIQEVDNDSKLCEFCAEPISASAIICPLCGERLTETLPQHQIIEVLKASAEELDAHTSDLENIENDIKLAGKTIGAMTITLSIISLLSLAMIVGGAVMKDGTGLIVFGVILLFCFGLGFLVALTNDLKAKISDNETPLKAFKSFVGAITTNRTTKAFARLIPSARNLTRTTYPNVEKINIDTGQLTMTSVEEMKKYWKGLIKPTSGCNRTCGVKGYKIVSGGGPEDKYAIAEVELKVTTYPSILIALVLINLLVCLLVILIVQKKEPLTFRKLMIKSNGKWYFASGDFECVLDELESVEEIS